ncbi:MAG: 23S rRNA (pseudouridine(1915)-N(3))-methyltransferase RlmH [Rhodocyclaceae bacterium]
MRLRVIAVGTRMPGWADEAFRDYARRMPREAAIELCEIRPEPRNGRSRARLLEAEAERMAAAIPRAARIVALDEHGADLDTKALARRLAAWLEGGADVALLVGGADGIDPRLKERAAETLRLSSLTLPHALARVVAAEALYRAWTVLKKHPYHRA